MGLKNDLDGVKNKEVEQTEAFSSELKGTSRYWCIKCQRGTDITEGGYCVECEKKLRSTKLKDVPAKPVYDPKDDMIADLRKEIEAIKKSIAPKKEVKVSKKVSE